mgnify:CR=1 FL=1
MIALDEDALICDLAREYHIYDYRSLPCKTVAALSFGLRNESKIKMKIMGLRATTEQMLLASIADRVGELEWMQTKDGVRGRNRPVSILKEMIEEEREKDTVVFGSGEEFDAAWEKAVGRG